MAMPEWVREEVNREALRDLEDLVRDGEMTQAEFDEIANEMGVGSNSSDPVRRGEAIFDGTDYPREWDGFVGQAQAKEQLQVQVASAKARNARLEHTLLASGMPGIGKTTLASLLAYQAGAGVVQVAGVVEIDKARSILRKMQDGDILFWDEIHQAVSAGKSKAEWLLPFMTEGKLYTDEGVVDCPNVTIVGATTDAGRLPETIISRFMVKPKLVPYSECEGAEIALKLADRMGVGLTDVQAKIVTTAANHNPRDMRSILTAVRDLQFAFPEAEVDMAKALKWAGFSEDGLTQIAREILVLLRMQKDHTASLESLRAMLSEPGPIGHHERELMVRGFVTVTGRGRKLTPAGLARSRKAMLEL